MFLWYVNWLEGEVKTFIDVHRPNGGDFLLSSYNEDFLFRIVYLSNIEFSVTVFLKDMC
jgi:hypothetical protein